MNKIDCYIDEVLPEEIKKIYNKNNEEGGTVFQIMILNLFTSSTHKVIFHRDWTIKNLNNTIYNLCFEELDLVPSQEIARD